MEISIEKISKGDIFCVEFNSIKVERCHYINASEERVENTTILSNTKAVMLRVQNGGTIFVQLTIQGRERIFAQFKTLFSFYHKDENHNVEVAQTAMVRGNEIKEEYPIDIEELEYGKINLFSISKQKGRIISFFIINPKSHDDYYYRVIFSE